MKEKRPFIYCKYWLSDIRMEVLFDFAENYSFIVQDAVQSFEYSATTVHAFIAKIIPTVKSLASITGCCKSSEPFMFFNLVLN